MSTTFPSHTAPLSSARRLTMLLLLAGPLAYALLSLALGQDANWDLRNYHWYAGYSWIEGRHGFDLVPSQIPSFYNPFLDVPLYWLATALPARGVGFVLGVIHGLNFVLLFGIARALLRAGDPVRNTWMAAALAAAGVLGAGGIAQIGTTFHDNVLSLGALASVLIVVAFRRTLFGGALPGAFALAALAGLPAGAAMGLKLTAALYPVGFCVAFLAVPVHPGRRLFLAFFYGLGVLAGLALAGGPWMAFLWERYGNPLFPYFNHIFRSPLAAISDYRDSHFADLSPGLLDRLLLPFRMVADPNLVGEIPLPGETPWRDLRLPVLYGGAALVSLLGIFGRTADDSLSDRTAGRWLLAGWLAALGVWLALFCIYRYTLALEMLAPVGIAVAAGFLPLGRRLRWVLGLGAVALVQLLTVPGTWGRIDWTERLVMVDVPDIPRPEETMVLMGGYQPLSFVIPEFPRPVAFVRIQSTFIHPDSTDNGYLRVLRDRVAEHGGDFYLLSTVPDTDLAARGAEVYGLRIDRADCRVVRSNLNEPLNFCRLYRP